MSLNGILVSCNGRKYQAFAVALVNLNRHRFGFANFMDDNRLARPRIHDLADIITPRLNLQEIRTLGVPGRRDEEAAASLKVISGYKKSLSVLRDRLDDYWLIKSEMHRNPR